VIVPDVNLLLYAHFTVFAEHPTARRWWEDVLNGSEPVGLGAPAVFGFIRLATSARVFDPPLSVEAATSHVEGWLARPHVRVLAAGSRHVEIAFAFLRQLGAGGNLTTDVQLASLAVEHQAELHSNDGDFGRFRGLRWVNPLRVP
jgi:toxin-antitoxin system PIN domain toxin